MENVIKVEKLSNDLVFALLKKKFFKKKGKRLGLCVLSFVSFPNQVLSLNPYSESSLIWTDNFNFL